MRFARRSQLRATLKALMLQAGLIRLQVKRRPRVWRIVPAAMISLTCAHAQSAKGSSAFNYETSEPGENALNERIAGQRIAALYESLQSEDGKDEVAEVFRT